MEPSTAEPPDPSLAGYQVDDLIVDIGQQRVTRNGIEIPFAHLSFELLVTLARAAPNLVTFDQLTERVWPGLVITPETISQRVKLVRGALGRRPACARATSAVCAVAATAWSPTCSRSPSVAPRRNPSRA